MAPSPLAPTCASLLAEEIRAVETFLGVLKEEEAALVVNKLDTLLVLADRKGEMSAGLNAQVERRETARKAAGFGPGREGMAAWAAADKSGECIGLWQRLLELAAQARAQNEINGKLIAVHFRHNQRALATLMAAADRATTYDASGVQRGGGSGRLLGSA